MSIEVESDGAVRVVTLNRPEVRNAVDRETAEALSAANAGRPLAEGTALQRAISEFVSPGRPGPQTEASRIKRGLARLFSSSPA